MVVSNAPVVLAGGPVLNSTRISMGLITPNLFRVGDIGRLASLAAPRRLTLYSALDIEGGVLQPDELSQAFAHARKIYRLYNAQDRLGV